jgi:putative endonuclease
MSWQVYIVECADGTYYTGASTDVQRRVEAHNSGCGARYTRARRPVKLRWISAPLDKGEALSLECNIKKMPRAKKELLCTST